MVRLYDDSTTIYFRDGPGNDEALDASIESFFDDEIGLLVVLRTTRLQFTTTTLPGPTLPGPERIAVFMKGRASAALRRAIEYADDWFKQAQTYVDMRQGGGCKLCGMACNPKDGCCCNDDCPEHGTGVGIALQQIRQGLYAAGRTDLLKPLDVIASSLYPEE